MLPGLKTPDGALYIIESAPAAGDPANGGVSMTNDGWVHVDGLLPPQVFANGFGFRNNGALCINKFGTAIEGYQQGLPFNSAGQLVCQLNQPVSPGDAYVGGLRVGPLGGLYVVDAAPVWTPANLFASGEQGAWFDPSDLSTMFQDSSGTTPVTADGQPVGKILDKSGNGNHASQATATARPLYKTDGTYHWLQFDGVDDSLGTAAINFTVTSKITVNAGFSIGASANYQNIFALGAVGSPAGGFYIQPQPSGADLSVTTGSGGFGMFTSSRAFGVNTKRVLSVSYDYLASTYQTVSTIKNILPDTWSWNAGGSYVAQTTAGNLPLIIQQHKTLPIKLFSVIVRGALSDAQEITATETWVNSKTGAY